MGSITDMIGQLGGAYIASQTAQPVNYMSPFGPISPTPAIGVPFFDVIPEAQAGACGTQGMVWNPSANCGQGKWQRKSRRRRKRLATQGDLKDLAALKGVLGGGKAFETWIATHGGR